MVQVSLDTSFLITFSDSSRRHHAVAVDYFRHCLAERIPMRLSTIAAGEFAIGQPVTDLPLQCFRIEPYNLPHAILAASYYRALQSEPLDRAEHQRRVVQNDLKILAQAAEESVTTILTEDAATLAKMAARLREKGLSKVEVLLLSEGFSPNRLANPAQTELPLSNQEE